MNSPDGNIVRVSLADLEHIATSLDDAAVGLHGHADTIAGLNVPSGAFGASSHLAAAFETHRLEIEAALRSAGGQVESHASGARATGAVHRANSADGAAAFNALRPA